MVLGGWSIESGALRPFVLGESGDPLSSLLQTLSL
jgi:hypothetical protein